MIELLPVARSQFRWNEVQKNPSSKSCEKFLADYPDGVFGTQARKWLPDLLRNELLNDRDNPPLRRRYLDWRTQTQRKQDHAEWEVFGVVFDRDRFELADVYGPLSDWETIPQDPRKVLLGE